jgi:hypothetical protein
VISSQVHSTGLCHLSALFQRPVNRWYLMRIPQRHLDRRIHDEVDKIRQRMTNLECQIRWASFNGLRGDFHPAFAFHADSRQHVLMDALLDWIRGMFSPVHPLYLSTEARGAHCFHC